MEEDSDLYQSLLWGDDHNMESTGYMIINSFPKLENFIPDDSTAFRKGDITKPVIYWEEKGENFKPWMEDGIDMDAILRNSLRKDSHEVIHQPIRVISLDNLEGLGPKRAHPHPTSVSIFRPVGVDLGPTNGMFKVYPSSHSQTKEQLDKNSVRDVYLKQNQVLVALGPLWIEFPDQHSNPGGKIMWKGFSVGTIAGFVGGKDVLPFME